MVTKNEALKMAEQFGFIKYKNGIDWASNYDNQLINLITALKQPAQEQLSGKAGELKPVAYAYIREDGVGQLCWTKRDASLFIDFLEEYKEIPLYTKEKNHGN